MNSQTFDSLNFVVHDSLPCAFYFPPFGPAQRDADSAPRASLLTDIPFPGATLGARLSASASWPEQCAGADSFRLVPIATGADVIALLVLTRDPDAVMCTSQVPVFVTLEPLAE
jgi:hypothetical protein